MAKRFLLKQFAKDANNNGVYGSYQAGNPTYSNDPETIQSLPAWFTGWINATTSGTLLPRLEEMQGVQKVLCEAIKENYREGVPEWIKGEEYYKNSIVSYSPDGTFNLYYNTTGDYTDKAPDEDTVNWANLSSLFIDKKYLEENYINLNTISNCLLKSNDSTGSSKYNAAYVNFGTTIASGDISNFSPQRYIVLTKPFPDVANAQITDAWRIQTGRDITTQQVLICAPTIDNSIGVIDGRFYICLGGKLQKGTKALVASKNYYLKLSWTTTNVRLQVSEDNKSYTEDINFATTEQPMAGKTTLLGRGDTANAETFFTGSMYFPVFKNKNGTVYWNSTTASNVNLIHFLGTFECLAPNGRDANNNLKNETFTDLVDSFMNYTPLASDGTKTVLLTNKGELMAREKYTEAATAPGGAKLNDVWYDTEKNFMYQQSTEQPNFITNGSIQVNRGIVSGFASGNSLILDNGNNGVFDKSLVTNLLEVELTTGATVTEAGGSNYLIPLCVTDNYELLTNNKVLILRVRLQSYRVGIRTDEGDYSNIKYVNSGDYRDENGYITSGTTLYNTNVCQSAGSISCPPNQYEYVTGNAETLLIDLRSKVTLSTSTAYNIGIVYLDGKWTLMVGDIVDEYESYAKTMEKDFKVGFGLTDALIQQGKPFNGTINLANTTFSGWEWNGVSTSSLNWNQFIGCKIGTITQKSGNITVSIDKPVELVKKVDFDKGIANLQSQISSNDTDIAGIKGNYVTTNTAQTITSDKTFQDSKLDFKDTHIVRDEKPDSNYTRKMISYCDKNGSELGLMSGYIDRNGYQSIRFDNRNYIEGGSSETYPYNNITFRITNNGVNGYVMLDDSGLNNQSHTFVTNSSNNKTIPTMGWVNNPATSTNVVHRTGNETIGGIKVINSDYTVIKSVAIDETVTPSSTQYCTIQWHDKNNKEIGSVYSAKGSGGTNFVELHATAHTSDGASHLSYINLAVDPKTGGASAKTINPNSNSNDTSIATTSWVTSAPAVVHTTGTETINGTKTFTGAIKHTNTVQINNTKQLQFLASDNTVVANFQAGTEGNFMLYSNGGSRNLGFSNFANFFLNGDTTLAFNNTGYKTIAKIKQGSTGTLYISNTKDVDATGTQAFKVPTPSASPNGKEAVNVEYLNDKLTKPVDIMKMICPDWSKKQSLNLNADITISKYGWVLMRNTTYISIMTGKINRQIVFEQKGTYGDFEDWNSIICPVSIGDVVRLDSNDVGEFLFIPSYGNS